MVVFLCAIGLPLGSMHKCFAYGKKRNNKDRQSCSKQIGKVRKKSEKKRKQRSKVSCPMSQ